MYEFWYFEIFNIRLSFSFIFSSFPAIIKMVYIFFFKQQYHEWTTLCHCLYSIRVLGLGILKRHNFQLLQYLQNMTILAHSKVRRAFIAVQSLHPINVQEIKMTLYILWRCFFKSKDLIVQPFAGNGNVFIWSKYLNLLKKH